MKVLIIDAFPEDFLQALAALPVEVSYRPQDQRSDILPQLAAAEILVMNSKIRLDREAIDAAPQLKLVLRAGVGMDHIEVAYLEERGVIVRNTIGANADAVGEQTVGMLLALRHWIVRADQQVRQFQWKRAENRGREIGGKTIGLIGYGHTGKAVARKLSGFGCRVLAYDKYLTDYGDAYATEASLDQIFAEAEVCSLHIPLTEETHKYADAAFFARFAQPIFFLNLARGPITDLPALLAALDREQVLGAALDVLENEKLPTLTDAQRAAYTELFARPNVIITPHIGGWSFESRQNINQRLLAEIKALLEASL
ncbi:MAG: NAD(P)-dependent oxidoreductase [Bacteroidota bacterium]